MSKKFTILLYFSNLPFSKIEHKHTLFFPFLVLVVARYCKTVYLRTHSRFVLVSGLSVSLCDNIFKNLYCRNVSPPKPHRRVGQESKFCLHLWAPSIIWCIAGKRVFFLQLNGQTFYTRESQSTSLSTYSPWCPHIHLDYRLHRSSALRFFSKAGFFIQHFSDKTLFNPGVWLTCFSYLIVTTFFVTVYVFVIRGDFSGV